MSKRTEGRLGLAVALAALACVFSLTSCVTSADLVELAESVGQVEAVLNDFDGTDEELRAAVAGVAETTATIEERVTARTESAVDGIEELVREGGVAGLAVLLLNLWRNSTRRRELEKMKGGGNA
jgi:hypothetical protein